MKRASYILLLLVAISNLFSQTSTFSIELTLVNEICLQGAAEVKVSGGKLPYTITWSTGETNATYITKLNAGNYFVNIKDSTNKDTVVNFSIVKEECPVSIANHFTPNDDNYNDTWKISNTQFYPEFELFVFNKWGQQVHHQKDHYTPWDGKWNGVSAADGTYYYVFYFKKSDKDKFLKGDVSILR